MPLYTYACTHCGEELEVLRRITESDTLPTQEELAGLPSCTESEHKLERKIGPTSFQLMGYGWYNKGGY